jgi:arylsulfatase A-like enzyme
MSAEDQADVDFERLSMYRSLLAVDDAVGAIVSALESSGRLSTTLIVLASDNGFLWGEHRWAGKKVAYEESIRIPMVVRYDPLVPAPRVDGRFALNVDLAPTFAAAAGVPAPGAEGTSLLPLLPGTAVPWRKDFLIENALNSGGADEVPTFCAVRNRRFLYAQYLATGEEELYDLEEDVGQLDSVSGDPGYVSKLLTLRARSGVLCVPPPPLSVPGQPGD